MAFAIENFYLDRASFNTSTQVKTFAIHRYINLDDTIIQIESSDYFPPFFGYDYASVQQNDYLSVQSSDSFGNLYRIGYDSFGFVTLTSITQSMRTYTFNSTVLNLSESENPPFSMLLYKQGVFVTAYVPFFTYSSTGISGVATVADALPVEFAPVFGNEIKAPIIVNELTVVGLSYGGMFKINDGFISVGPVNLLGNPSVFAGPNVTWYPIFLTWVTN